MAPSSIAHQGNEDHTHSSMMVWRVHEFGPPDVMRFERIHRPHPSPGEVLVKVKAAGVGPWDGWIRAGKSALPQPLPLTLGSDLSGEVVAVESGDLRVGDQVYGVTNPQFIGAYAEYALASAAMVSRKPTSLTHIEAASVPVIAVTAWQALFDQAQLKAGQTVVIHGAAGNVGAYAVQLARRADVRITATAATDDILFLRNLGANTVIDYKTQRFEEEVRDADAVWQIKFKKKPNQEGSFDKNLEALHKRKIVSDEWKAKLDEMWAPAQSASAQCTRSNSRHGTVRRIRPKGQRTGVLRQDHPSHLEKPGRPI
jgi:NADPH:quinone reductase-like Zn-dependent oxidoreductase